MTFATLVVLTAMAWPADAADFVVVAARGVNLSPGQIVDGDKPIALADGQQVVLISQTGVTVKLRGPDDEPPAHKTTGSTADVVGALKALVTREQASSEQVATVRGASTDPVPPEPWLINVTHGGTRCALQARPVVLWRPGRSGPAEIVITPYDHSWEARADWPGGQSRLALSSSVPLRDQTSYEIRMAGKDTVFTFLVLPRTVNNDAMRAAWMIDEGCEVQAEALLKRAH
ncbi:MAG: hypothetical protein KGJ66_12835 [Alphaproteobacteria bacterium]|nr:hypothetical protein [Alphaproteobacteria bacterium]